MRVLADIQREFLNRILADDSKTGLLPPPSGPSESGKYSAAVYRDLVATNHLNALKDAYPVCLRLVGGNYFSYLAWNYLKERPTADPDLNRYGNDFPDFLELEAGRREELRSLGYLPDVSRFEWSLYSASRAGADAVPLEGVLFRLTSLGDKDAVFFRVNPSLSLMKSGYPVVRIWKENRLEDVGEIVLDEVIENVVVWKYNGDVLYETVDEETYHLLNLIREGVPLGGLNESYEKRGQELERLITRSITSGWIVDVEDAVR